MDYPIVDLTADIAAQHAHRWRDKDDDYWLKRMVQEVGELASVLANDHDDTVEHELFQIASITINWLDKRMNNED